MDKELVLKRLLSNSTVTEDGHLLWQGRTKDGYGIMWVGSRKSGHHYGVHRLSAYIHLELDLDNDKQYALHKLTCKYRNCWSKDCIYVGTNAQNGKDYRLSRTRCKNGHSLDVYGYITRRASFDPSLRLKCRLCDRNIRRKYNQKQTLTQLVSKTKGQNK